jgi:hypothetical protein
MRRDAVGVVEDLDDCGYHCLMRKFLPILALNRAVVPIYAQVSKPSLQRRNESELVSASVARMIP